MGSTPEEAMGYQAGRILMHRVRRLTAWLLGAGFWLKTFSTLAGGGAIEIRDGYFFDPTVGNYFIPRGIAYQTWNPPVGAYQSFEQIEYDLREFKKLGANSVRCEFVWSQVEVADGTYDWSKPDFLISVAEKLGLKLF